MASTVISDARTPSEKTAQCSPMPLDERIFSKSLKFLVVGGINTVVTYGIYVLLVRLGWHYTIALLIEYTIGIIAGYHMNRHWTFAGHGSRVRSSLKYCVTYGIVFCLNLVLLGLIVELGVLGPIAGQVVVIGTITVISFLLQNFWVFRSAKDCR
jgi:putative flippase GtrA